MRTEKPVQAFSPRRTRSRAKQKASEQGTLPKPGPVQLSEAPAPKQVLQTTADVQIIPTSLTVAITKLSANDHRLLLKKQSWLRDHDLVIPRGFRKNASSVDAALVFAQEEAGTAVCIGAGGLLLTCSHCIAESPEELKKRKTHWLLFKSGSAVKARCIAWDPVRDLALLQIIAAQTATSGSHDEDEPDPASSGIQFPFVHLDDGPPTKDAPMICVGHPGSEDLEAGQPGILTNYDVLHVSAGRFRGYAAGQDLQDNSEIGALMHDCWTYWGHSGAPIIGWGSGALVGLHSSWDDETGMRRGIAWEAIREFLEENR